MRKTLIAAIAATMLLGCGKDSTGPGDNANPNPDPKHYTITVQEGDGTTFAPETTKALVGDVILWTVAKSATGQHQITFIDQPSGVPTPNPSKILVATQSDSAIFLQHGTYKYQDLMDQSGSADTGIVLISPLPN